MRQIFRLANQKSSEQLNVYKFALISSYSESYDVFSAFRTFDTQENLPHNFVWVATVCH